MTVAIPTPNTAAALRRDTPLSTARTTRSRKSREYGRAMHAGPLPSMQLESQFLVRRNPLFRLRQTGYCSSWLYVVYFALFSRAVAPFRHRSTPVPLGGAQDERKRSGQV